MPSRTWPEHRRGTACSSVCLSISLSFTRLPPSTTDLVNPTLVPGVLVCLMPRWHQCSHLGSMRVWGLPAAVVGKTHGPPNPWNDWSLGLFSEDVPYPPKRVWSQSFSMGVSSATSQILRSSSVLDLPLCSHCLLEERDRAYVRPEGPGRCESAVPLSQFCLSLGSPFFPLCVCTIPQLSAPTGTELVLSGVSSHWRA